MEIEVKKRDMPSFINHIHASKKLFDKLNLFKKHKYELELALLGSIIVDLDEFGVVPKIHGKSREFFDYLLINDPEYAPLAIGMILHEAHDAVIDKEFVHPNEEKAKQLVKEHSTEFGSYHLIGHYLLDQSMDFHLIKKNPEVFKVVEKIRTTLKDRHAKKIAYHLSAFFNGNYDEVLHALKTFKNFDISKFKTIDGICDVWTTHVFLKMHKDEIAARQKLGFFDRLTSNIKLGLQYGSFRVNNQKENLLQLFSNAFDKFKNNNKVIKKTDDFLEVSLNKVLKHFPVPKILNKAKSKINA